MRTYNDDKFVKAYGLRDAVFDENRRQHFEDIGFKPVIKHYTDLGFKCVTNEQAEFSAYLPSQTDKKHLPDILIIDNATDTIKFMIDVMTKSERNWGPGWPIYKHGTVDLLKRKEKYIPLAESFNCLFLWVTVRADGNRFYEIDHKTLQAMNLTPVPFGRPSDWGQEPQMVYPVPRDKLTLVIPKP